jgi:tRNA U34 5-methylaminomethyl-2-thiouridine-forming methyltransferase MnmC
MNFNFCPIETEDGTISLYNFRVNDIYHSKIGAHTEALNKFTYPSRIIDFATKNNEIKILDICFGLGYNSKVAIAEIKKVNPNCKILVDAIEMDENVLALSCLFSEESFSDFEKVFFKAISKHINAESIINYFAKNYADLCHNFKEKLPEGYNFIPNDKLNQKLHNIYYRTISTRNTSPPDTHPPTDLLTVNIYNTDARKAISHINNEYDFVFLDAFTPAKLPTLWTVEFFRKIYDLLNENGNLTTYTSAAPVRAGLIEAGFFVGSTIPIGKKTPGTFACKKNVFINYPLTEKETKLLDTKAGIPYYDKDFCSSAEVILSTRESMQKTSKRLPSGKFLKSFPAT